MKYPESLPSSDRRRRSQLGYTLWEVLVVVVIIAMLVVIGYPILWRSRVRARMLSEVKMVQQATMVARVNAVKQSRRVAMKILDDDSTQEGGLMIAWVDDNADGLQTSGEDEVGRWVVKDGYFIREGTVNKLFRLSASDTARGVVFLPSGVTIASASGAIGVGQGSVVMTDDHQNRIRLMIQGGSGTVQMTMWDPDESSYSDEIRFWRY